MSVGSTGRSISNIAKSRNILIKIHNRIWRAAAIFEYALSLATVLNFSIHHQFLRGPAALVT
jgi:hypothetical protein